MSNNHAVIAKLTSNLKKKLTRKFHEFQVAGLKKYGKYLDEQLRIFRNKSNAAAYIRDIERQIADKEKN